MPVITETSEKKWNKVDKLEISKLLPACHLRILIKLWLKILRKDSCDKHRNGLLKRTKGSWYHLTSIPFLCMCSQGGFLTLRMRNMCFFFNLLEHWNQIVNQLSYPLGPNCLTVNELHDQTARLRVTKNVMAKIVTTTANCTVVFVHINITKLFWVLLLFYKNEWGEKCSF